MFEFLKYLSFTDWMTIFLVLFVIVAIIFYLVVPFTKLFIEACKEEYNRQIRKEEDTPEDFEERK